MPQSGIYQCDDGLRRCQRQPKTDQLAAVPRVGAENPVTSCDLHVFVDDAAEPVSS
jgi:hypothetical protein